MMLVPKHLSIKHYPHVSVATCYYHVITVLLSAVFIYIQQKHYQLDFVFNKIQNNIFKKYQNNFYVLYQVMFF